MEKPLVEKQVRLSENFKKVILFVMSETISYLDHAGLMG